MWRQLKYQGETPYHFAELSEQEAEWAARSQRAQAAASQALERLLSLAETCDSGQIRTVAHFIASTFDGQNFPFDPFALRAVDVAISDDITGVPGCPALGKSRSLQAGAERPGALLAVCAAWGLKWPED